MFNQPKVFNMKNTFTLIFFISCFLISAKSLAQVDEKDAKYTYKTGDFNGIGKWYMGREIAYVMGFQGIDWLERSEREKEEDVSALIKNMKIKSVDHIADIGAGSGYHAFKMASLAENGLIYAVDIQSEMLHEIELKKKSNRILNIETILGSEKGIHLPKHSLDKVLLVDVYHEFSYPLEMIESIKNKANYLLQEKVAYHPIIETLDEPAKCEIRMMLLHNKKDNTTQIVSNLMRLSKGEMIGVKYNKDKTWVGGSTGFFEI